jgi:hypothetical protein
MPPATEAGCSPLEHGCGAININGARPASPSADVVLGELAAGPSPTISTAASDVQPLVFYLVGCDAADRVLSGSQVSSGAANGTPSSRPADDGWPALFLRELKERERWGRPYMQGEMTPGGLIRL